MDNNDFIEYQKRSAVMVENLEKRIVELDDRANYQKMAVYRLHKRIDQQTQDARLLLERYQSLRGEYAAVRKENLRLIKLLREHGIEHKQPGE